MTSWIVAAFLVGPLVVVPLGLRLIPSADDALARRLGAAAITASIPAGVALAAAFLLPAGLLAAGLAVPWFGVASLAAGAAVLDILHRPAPSRPEVAHAFAAARGFLLVGALFALTDRLGIRPFDFGATIILLTAVHFHFAGVALVLAGALAYRRRPTRWIEFAIGAVVVGIPITALGFFGFPLANWVGSMLVAVGGFGIGIGTWHCSGSLATRGARVLARVAAVSLWLAMPMAAAYATGTFLGTTWLDIPTMARIHGSINALGFAVPVMIAWSLDARTRAHALRAGPSSPIDVIGFNWPPFVLAPTIALSAGLAAMALPAPLGPLLAAGALAAVVAFSAAVGAIIWVFEFGAETRWQWIADAAGEPDDWLNLTTGFDDSTATLTGRVAGHGIAVDLHEEAAVLDPPQRRARRRFPPWQPSIAPGALGGIIAPGSLDVVFLLMAIHEVHGVDRQRLFEAVAQGLRPGGRLVVIEHLRDAANAAAFGLGARHFQRRRTWIEAASVAGLAVVDERSLSPFVRGFVFGRAA